MSELSKEVFDKDGLEYHKHMRITGHYSAQRRLLSKVNKLIQEPILDLACGPGYLLTLLTKKFKIVCGNDLSKVMTDYSKIKTPNVLFMNCDSHTIKTKIKFNTLICTNLFYHLTNTKKAIKTWNSLLPKKGKLIFMEEYPFIISKANTKFSKLQKQMLSLVKPITPDELKNIVELNGFKFIKRYKTKIDSYHSLYCQIFEKI